MGWLGLDAAAAKLESAAAREQMVLFGGASATYQAYGDLWVWDGRTWAELPDSGGPSARVPASMAYDAARQQVVLFGGTLDPSAATLQYVNDTWTWDGRRWTKR